MSVLAATQKFHHHRIRSRETFTAESREGARGGGDVRVDHPFGPLHTAVVDGIELPIGSMFLGRFGEDALLLSLAAQLEAEVGWRHPHLSDW